MIEDGILLLLILATDFLNMSLVYTTIFGMGFIKNRKKIVLVIVTLLCSHLLLLELFGLEDALGMSIFTMLAIPLFLLSGRKLTLLGVYPFTVIMASVVSVSVSFLVAKLMGVTESAVIDNPYLSLLCQCVQLIFMGLWTIYRKVKKQEAYRVHLDIKQYILLYTVAVCEFLMLAPLQAMSGHPEWGEDVTTVGVSVSVACIVFVLLAVWQGIVVNREIKLRERNAMLEQYMQLQKDYYTEIIAKDEELRRFRHDMSAHMSVLRAHCENVNNNELKQYVDNLIEETTRYERKTYTGNNSVDAILGQAERTAEEKKIRFTVEGALPNCTKVEDYDLCIIVSNLLSNALEACEEIRGPSERYVEIRVGSYEEKLYLEVRNSVCHEIRIEQNRLYTTKADVRNHGIGSENVARTVKKYEGTVTYRCENACFTAEICL